MHIGIRVHVLPGYLERGKVLSFSLRRHILVPRTLSTIGQQ